MQVLDAARPDRTQPPPGSRLTRALTRARPPLVDLALATAFVLMTTAEALFSEGVRSPLVHLVVAGMAMACLAWRRTVPIGVAALVVASTIATNPQGQFSTVLSLVLICYTIGAETEPPRSYAGLALVVVPFLAAMTRNPAGFQPSDLAAAVVFLFGPWTVGAVVRQRGARTAEALARAERLEREQLTALEQERTRIARELHDIVSHSISVITIQTQAVRRRLPPEQAREAHDLAAVEATAREALAEMRRLFGVLRSDGESPALAPQPGLHELDRLVAQVRGSGLDVELDVTGQRCELPPGVDLTAYRIVQEGLTNALRHSGGEKIRVQLTYCPGRLDITVDDDGRGLDTGEQGGHGLIGVRERVTLYGGTVDVGPGPAGGVRLAASLPVPEMS